MAPIKISKAQKVQIAWNLFQLSESRFSVIASLRSTIPVKIYEKFSSHTFIVTDHRLFLIIIVAVRRIVCGFISINCGVSMYSTVGCEEITARFKHVLSQLSVQVGSKSKTELEKNLEPARDEQLMNFNPHSTIFS